MINPEFIKCISESMFQKHSEKNNSEVIFNRNKIDYREFGLKEMVGVQEEICSGATKKKKL